MFPLPWPSASRTPRRTFTSREIPGGDRRVAYGAARSHGEARSVLSHRGWPLEPATRPRTGPASACRTVVCNIDKREDRANTGFSRRSLARDGENDPCSNDSPGGDRLEIFNSFSAHLTNRPGESTEWGSSFRCKNLDEPRGAVHGEHPLELGHRTVGSGAKRVVEEGCTYSRRNESSCPPP